MREGRLAEVRTLFQSLVGLSPEARFHVLAERCSPDEELRVFVGRMLANYDGGMGNFLEPLVHPISSRSESAMPSADSMALPTIFALGERVAERYRVERLLGQGGMGEVYEVWDDELAIPLALKTLRFGPAQERAIRRLKQEAMLARAVVHPSVCRVYDLGRHDDADHAVWFLTMEVLRGETLRERLGARGSFTPEEALPVVEQMAAGLGAAHQAGVVHGDFKSGNVMLVESPEGEQAVITDFGLAQEVGDRPDGGLTARNAMASPAPLPTWLQSRCREIARGPRRTSTRWVLGSTRWSRGVCRSPAARRGKRRCDASRNRHPPPGEWCPL